MQSDGRPPLLLIPGLAGSCRALATAAVDMFPRFRLIPSFHRVESERDTIEDLAGRIASLIPEGEATYVCGESFGGAIALTLARAYPERVQGLILLSTFARLPRAGTARARVLVAIWAHLIRNVPPLAYGVRIAGMPGQMGRLVPPGAVLAYVREPLSPGRDYQHKVRLIAGFDARPWLGEVQRPSIVVLGRRDPVVPPAAGRELGRLLPNAVVRELACGHLAYLAAPREVRHAVESWLALTCSH